MALNFMLKNGYNDKLKVMCISPQFKINNKKMELHPIKA